MIFLALSHVDHFFDPTSSYFLTLYLKPCMYSISVINNNKLVGSALYISMSLSHMLSLISISLLIP